MKADLTHQHVARVLLQKHAHLFTKGELSFLQGMSFAVVMTDRQEDYLAALDERRREDVR